MTLSAFLKKLKSTPSDVKFPETIAVIEENYDFRNIYLEKRQVCL